MTGLADLRLEPSEVGMSRIEDRELDCEARTDHPLVADVVADLVGALDAHLDLRNDPSSAQLQRVLHRLHLEPRRGQIEALLHACLLQRRDVRLPIRQRRLGFRQRPRDLFPPQPEQAIELLARLHVRQPMLDQLELRFVLSHRVEITLARVDVAGLELLGGELGRDLGRVDQRDVNVPHRSCGLHLGERHLDVARQRERLPSDAEHRLLQLRFGQLALRRDQERREQTLRNGEPRREPEPPRRKPEVAADHGILQQTRLHQIGLRDTERLEGRGEASIVEHGDLDRRVDGERLGEQLGHPPLHLFFVFLAGLGFDRALGSTPLDDERIDVLARCGGLGRGARSQAHRGQY